MSTERLYRFLCDAPHCDATGIGEDFSNSPKGWLRLGSTDHIQQYDTPRRGRGSRQVSWLDRQAGKFSVDVCPEHLHVFDEHRPMSSGHPGSRGSDAGASVACSCGAKLGWARAAILCGWKPSLTTERLWWAHLPEELRWYATRDPAAVAS